jgi:hypothetical protein
MLIVQIPSVAHTSGVGAIAHELILAMGAMEAEEPRVAGRWQSHFGGMQWYEQTQDRGLFIPDATLNVEEEPLLYVEVTFSQTWADLRGKVGRILADAPASLLGILVMDIAEVGKWSRPEMPSVANDFISKHEWSTCFKPIGQVFSRIVAHGHVWMHDINIKLCFFNKTWRAGDVDPLTVRFPGLITVIAPNSISVSPAAS